VIHSLAHPVCRGLSALHLCVKLRLFYLCGSIKVCNLLLDIYTLIVSIQLALRLNVINFKPEIRPYSPHLTIGRVKNGLSGRQLTQLGEVLDQEIRLIGELATLNVAELSLIKSELTPGGPVYTPLTRAAFQS